MTCYTNPESGKTYKDTAESLYPREVRAKITAHNLKAATEADDMATPAIQRIGDLIPQSVRSIGDLIPQSVRNIIPEKAKEIAGKMNFSIMLSPVERAYAFWDTAIGQNMPDYARISRAVFATFTPSVTGIGQTNKGALGLAMSLKGNYIERRLIGEYNQLVNKIKLEYRKEGKEFKQQDVVALQESLFDAKFTDTRFNVDDMNKATLEGRVNAIKNEMLEHHDEITGAIIKMAQTAGVKDEQGVGRGLSGFTKNEIKAGTERKFTPLAWNNEQLHKLSAIANGNTGALVAAFNESVFSAIKKSGKYIPFRIDAEDFKGLHVRIPTAEDIASILSKHVMSGGKGNTLFHNVGLNGNTREVIDSVQKIKRAISRNGLIHSDDLKKEFIDIDGSGNKVPAVKLSYSANAKNIEISQEAMNLHIATAERIVPSFDAVPVGDYVYVLISSKSDLKRLAREINGAYNKALDDVFGVVRDEEGSIIAMDNSNLIDFDTQLTVNGESPETGAVVNLAQGITFKDLLHKDLISSSIASFEQIIGRVALADEAARVFGNRYHVGSKSEFNGLLNAMSDTFQKEKPNIPVKDLSKAENILKEQQRDLRYLYDKLTGQPVGTNNMPEWLVKGSRITSKALQFQLLGMAGLSAVNEFSKVAAYNGVFRSLGVLSKVGHRELSTIFAEQAPKSELLRNMQTLVGNSFHTMDNYTRSHFESGETISLGSALERGLFTANYFQNKYISFMNPVTDLLEHTTNTAILGKITDLVVETAKLRQKDGFIPEDKLREVFKKSKGNWSDWRYVRNYLGVTEKEMDLLLQNFERNAKIDRNLTPEGIINLDIGIERVGDYYNGKHHMVYKQGHSWDDEAIYTLSKIIAREGRKTVQQNMAGEIPRILDNPIGRGFILPMYQFAATAYTKQFLTDMTYFNKSVVTAWMLEIMMIMTIFGLRDKLRNTLDARPPKEEEDELLQKYMRAASMHSSFGLPLTSLYDTIAMVRGEKGLGGGDPAPIPTPMIVFQVAKGADLPNTFYTLATGDQVTGNDIHDVFAVFNNSVPAKALEALTGKAMENMGMVE